jgi:hypothetical protein
MCVRYKLTDVLLRCVYIRYVSLEAYVRSRRWNRNSFTSKCFHIVQHDHRTWREATLASGVGGLVVDPCCPSGCAISGTNCPAGTYTRPAFSST